MRGGLTGSTAFGPGPPPWRATAPLAGHTADEYFALELEDMFRGLPAEDRALLLGRYFYGSTPDELAAARGISVGAVNTRVARARQRLVRLRERSGEK